MGFRKQIYSRTDLPDWLSVLSSTEYLSTNPQSSAIGSINLNTQNNQNKVPNFEKWNSSHSTGYKRANEINFSFKIFFILASHSIITVYSIQNYK